MKHSTPLFAAVALLCGCASGARPAPEAPPPSPAVAPRASAPDNTAEAQRPAALRRRRPPDPAAVHIYIMSKCPFASRLVPALADAIDKLDGRVELAIDYIANVGPGGQLKSLYGADEVEGDIQQLCVRSNHDQAQWLAFVTCQAQDFRNIPANGATCAKRAKIDWAPVAACVAGNQGRELLRASLERAKQARAMGSPTIDVGSKRASNARDTGSLVREICATYPRSRPPACSALPPEIEVAATVLTDKRCQTCRHEGLAKNMRQRFFPKLALTVVDYQSPRGRQLYAELAKHGIKHLPVWVFDATVKKAPGYARIGRWLKPRGPYLQMTLPATFDPTAEICDNKIDDTGNGAVDCADATCKANLACRPARPRTVQVFVRSRCPFSARALLALPEALKQLKGRVKLEVHYIARRKADGSIASLRGDEEVLEDQRQLCVKKLYGAKRFMAYLRCRAKTEGAGPWHSCAKRGIAASRVERCVANHGAQLLGRDMAIAESMRINGSPTWLINNRHKGSGVEAERIKTLICEHNPSLPGC